MKLDYKELEATAKTSINTAGSVYSFVSSSFHLIPEAGCGQRPQALINTGFSDIS